MVKVAAFATAIPTVFASRRAARSLEPESCELSGVTIRTAKTHRLGIIEGMNQLLTMLRNQKASIKQQRTEHGMEAKFSKLPSKELQKIVGVSSDLSC